METMLQAFTSADSFGKGIFLLLFAMSIVCWSFLLHRVWLIRQIERSTKRIYSVATGAKNDILSLSKKNFASSHPFVSIYTSMQEATKELLEKNHFFEHADRTYLSSPDVELVESHIEKTISQERERIERNFFILSTTVTLAPLLGLLGTVWGILVTFSEMTRGGALLSNSVILGGLSTALVTTVLGLVIAIPALVAFNYLKNSSTKITGEMYNFSHYLLSTLELHYRNPRQDIS